MIGRGRGYKAPGPRLPQPTKPQFQTAPASSPNRNTNTIHNQGGGFYCATCNKNYATRSGYDSHMSLHTGQFKHWCFQCQRGYSNTKNYEEHMAKHSGMKFPCSYCTKRFSGQRALDFHMSTHTGKYRLYCSVCNKGFNFKNDLETCENRHKGTGYACLQCKKMFYNQYSLKKHMEKCAG